MPEFEDISPRLNEIEKSLAGTRDSILGAAREAAESAVRSMAGSSANTAAVAGLAQDLKTLEALTRRSDERNSRTFEAIHDTLLKIVDRLGSLETSEPVEAVSELVDPRRRAGGGTRPAPRRSRSGCTVDGYRPAAAADGRHGRPRRPRAAIMRNEPGPRTPAEAAAAAAMAALGSDAIPEKSGQAGRKRSMFGGLARAFKGKKEAETPPHAGSAPSVDLDEPLDPKLANRPLEPGSGAPDLNAIMKRVRDERGQPARQSDSDAANSDFIAAARRAAQAAAAEADALKRQSTLSGPVKALRIGDLLKKRRKPILMATTAILLALGGLQLGKAFFADPAKIASNDAPIVAAQPVETASADCQRAEDGSPGCIAGQHAGPHRQAGRAVRTDTD